MAKGFFQFVYQLINWSFPHTHTTFITPVHPPTSPHLQKSSIKKTTPGLMNLDGKRTLQRVLFHPVFFPGKFQPTKISQTHGPGFSDTGRHASGSQCRFWTPVKPGVGTWCHENEQKCCFLHMFFVFVGGLPTSSPPKKQDCVISVRFFRISKKIHAVSFFLGKPRNLG